MLLLMIVISTAFVGQAFGATLSVTPTKVPKGAYVNGPGGATDDNFYWQMVTLTSAAVHAFGGAANPTITLPDGMTIADTDGDADYSEEISLTYTATNATMVLTPTSAAGADIVIAITVANMAIGDVVRIFIPVVTQVAPADSTQDYYVTFGDATDGIANGSGTFITYVNPGPKTLQLVSFAANLSANDDSTTKKGDRYPDTAAATFGALPDLINDTGAKVVNSANRAAEYGFPALNFSEDGNETIFTVWVSTDSTLAHVDSLTAGVFHAANYTSKLAVIQTEGGVGNLRYDMSGYPEGKYYFFITSYLTGDFPLARSDGLVVRHWPVANATGFDRDHNTLYAAGGADDAALTLDSGGYYNYAGVAAGTNTYTYVDIFVNVDDLDDDAKVHLFYSTNSALVDSNVVTTGSVGAGTLAITGLTSASVIKMNLNENSKDVQGFIRQRWETSPDSIAVISASALTVYTVVCDGKHFELSKLQGTAAGNLPEITQGAASLPINMKHSPKLVLDPLSEYETVAGGTYDINVSTVDQIMLSWGKTGTAGDVDADDDAIIDFYIIPDNLTTAGVIDAGLDFANDDATGVRTAANGHKINVTALQEKYEGKDRSWYVWDLKQEFQTSGWYPTAATAYILYAVISENKAVSNTEIVYTFNDTFLADGDAVQTITFTNAPFGKLSAPPAEGITVNAEETYRMPLTAFDWDSNAEVGIYVVKTSAAGFTAGPATATPAMLAALALGNAWCLTDADGDPVNGGTAYLSENTATYYDMTIRPPVAGGAAKYTRSMSTPGGSTLPDDTYWVYIGVGDGTIAAGTTLYRAPGPLTVVNAGVTTVQRNLTVSPMEATVAQGDTLTFIVKGSDNGATVDRFDAYISVDKTWWDLVGPSAPFTAAAAYSGRLIANQAINDSTNNRWILRTVVFNGGTTMDLADAGVGDDIASFRLVSKGTTDALQHTTAVGFVNDPGHSWVTKFSNDGVDQSINFLSSSVKVVPRAIMEGIVELQGRTQMNAKFTFELRNRGGYTAVSDSLFSVTNDADLAMSGLQIVPDTDGKFTLFKVPSGEYDLVAKYDRYLAKKVPLSVYPGVDTLFVSFGQLKGGDCYGYADSSKYVYPDNQVDTGDINRISTAFLATSSNSRWTNGLDNWKWADINEDGIVETDDLSMATTNSGQSGAQPVYKPAAQPGGSNTGSVVEFMNLPSDLKAGETYTIQVVARNTAAVRAYFVNLKYDGAALEFNGITKGGFIASDSYSFPVVDNGTVGLVNSAFGDAVSSGDGILAEVTFTARANGMFDANMLSFEKVSFVNGEFAKENLNFGPGTGTGGKAPLVFALGQNYPNPFNPNTVIGFTIPESGHVTLEVFDILGRHVRTLAAQSLASGRHSLVWNGRDDQGNMVSAGVYVYTIKSGKYAATKKMLFMK